jgi:hypothetical protein
VALLNQIDIAARRHDPRITNVLASLGIEQKIILVVTSAGVVVGDVQPLVRLSVTCIAEEDGKRQQGTAGGGGRVEFSFLTEDDRYLRWVRTAADQALRNLRAVDAPAGTMTVVLGPGWPGVLLHEAVGHGLEGDFNRKKVSAFTDRIGQRVASPLCTVIDDGTIANRRGSLNCDDEGNPTGRTVLIENGILRGYLQDRLNARLMGMPVTGNGRRESFAHMPMPRMTNTFMLAGESTPDEIIRSVPKRSLRRVVRRRTGRHHQRQVRLLRHRGVSHRGRQDHHAGQGRDADRQRAGLAHARVDGRQRPRTRRRHRHLRQGRPVGAGGRRHADHQDRQHDRRRNAGVSGLALDEIAALLLRGAREHGATAADVVVAEATRSWSACAWARSRRCSARAPSTSGCAPSSAIAAPFSPPPISPRVADAARRRRRGLGTRHRRRSVQRTARSQRAGILGSRPLALRSRRRRGHCRAGHRVVQGRRSGGAGG